MPIRKRLKHVSLGLAALLFVTAISFLQFDLLIARHFAGYLRVVQSYGLSSAFIIAGEFLVISTLAAARLVRGHLPAAAKALALASLASICAFAANDIVLKRIFGVPNPAEVLLGHAPHVFHLLQGSYVSSFPSGHMAMASAFAGVWIRLYPKTALAFFGLTSLGMIVLVMGDWHFLSDVIAGTVLGTTVGLITGELWLQHNASHRTAGKPARTA